MRMVWGRERPLGVSDTPMCPQGGKEYLMRAHFGLPSVEKEEVEGRPPIGVKFEIPYFTVSGIQVSVVRRCLRSLASVGSPFPWLKSHLFPGLCHLVPPKPPCVYSLTLCHLFPSVLDCLPTPLPPLPVPHLCPNPCHLITQRPCHHIPPELCYI